MENQLSEIELFIITSIHHLSNIFYTKSCPQTPIFEFLVCILPQYFTIAFLDYALFAYILFIILILVIPKAQREIQPLGDTIDRTQSVILTCITIALFAADFSFYHIQSPKLGISMSEGLRFMDIGVGSFVFIFGFFAPKTSFEKKIRNIIILFALGIIRFISKIVFQLSVDDAEFGKHLNFLFNLAFLNLCSLFIHTRYDFFIGMGLCILHECFLMFCGLKEMIFTTDRSNIIEANIEGISFTLPELGIFLISAGISKVYLSNKKSKEILLYGFIALVTFVISRTYSESIRRIHNLCFCMIIVLLHLTHGILFEYFGTKFSAGTYNLQYYSSNHLLLIFIFANILCFLNKTFLNPMQLSDILSHFICITYLFMIFCIPYYLNLYWNK